VTAIFGLGFYNAGMKAFDLVLKNALNIWTVRLVGNMVMAAGKIFVVLVTILVGVALLEVCFCI
jgi:hypothetical protein